MANPTFFDNIREWIGGVAFAVYLWSVRMTKEEFWAEQEKQALREIQTSSKDIYYPSKPMEPGTKVTHT